MNSEYLALAYQRSIFAALKRHLLEKYIEHDGNPKEKLICDEAPRALSEIPQDALAETLLRLEEEDRRLGLELAQFDHTRKDVKRIAHPDDDGDASGDPGA